VQHAATTIKPASTIHACTTRCNTLQHTAIHIDNQACSSNECTLQHAATRCNTLQHAATRCNTLRHAATRCNTPVFFSESDILEEYSIMTSHPTLHHAQSKHLPATATHCNALQHTASHCSTLQHTSTHCNTLQHTATHLPAQLSWHNFVGRTYDADTV